jgi:hypothetical protein
VGLFNTQKTFVQNVTMILENVCAVSVQSNQEKALLLSTILKKESKLKSGSKLETKVFILLSDALVMKLKDGINNTLLSLN